MYKSAGKFWAKNRSLAKRAIPVARIDAPSQKGRTKSTDTNVAGKTNSKQKPRGSTNIRQTNIRREQQGEESLFYLRCLLKEQQASIAKLKQEIRDRANIIDARMTVAGSDKQDRQDKKLRKMIRALDDLRQSVLTLVDKISKLSKATELNQHRGSGFSPNNQNKNRARRDKRQQKEDANSLRKMNEAAYQNRNDKRASNKNGKHKRPQSTRSNADTKQTTMGIAESGRQWWEVSGGLYGLGKNRKH